MEDLNALDNKESVTPLQKAIKEKQFEKVKKLIKTGVDVNSCDNRGLTAMYYAIEAHTQCSPCQQGKTNPGHPTEEIIILLHQHGATLPETFKDKPVDVWAMESRFNMEGSHDIFLKGILNKSFHGGKTLLMHAAGYNHYGKIKYLLDHGADINKTDDKGLTALNYATALYGKNECYDLSGNIIGYGSEDTIRLLLDRGARVDIKNEVGRPLYMWPQDIDPPMIRSDIAKRIFDQLIEKKYFNEILLYATCRGGKFMLEAMEQQGADFSIKDEYGSNLLMRLMQYHISVSESKIDILLKNGIDINERNPDGQTALMKACAPSSYWHSSNVIYLLERDADPDIQDNSGWTALMYAVDKNKDLYNYNYLPGDVEKFQELILLFQKKNTDFHLRNKDGETVYDIAKKGKNNAALKLLPD